MSDQDTRAGHDPAALLSQPHVKLLKFAVIAMGVMIVVGLAVVVGRIIYLATGSSTPAPTTASAPATGGQISLPPGARVKQMTMTNERLALHYEGKDTSGLIIVDLRTGQQISRFDIATKPEN